MTRDHGERELPIGLKFWIAVGAVVVSWAVLLGVVWLVVKAVTLALRALT